MKASILWLILIVSLPLYSGRDNPPETFQTVGAHPVIQKKQRIYIVDSEGEYWDITSAVKEYRMDPRFFHYGLGKDSFRPIKNPEVQPGPRWGDPWVFGVNYLGQARAYNRKSLTRHETVIDEIAGKRMLIAHCYLADLAGVYEARVDGKPLTLVASGWTYHNGHHDTFILYDVETNSLWFPFAQDDFFVAISGEMEGKKLQELAPMKKVKFSEWKKQHPDTDYVP
jgi:hypothetical protein